MIGTVVTQNCGLGWGCRRDGKDRKLKKFEKEAV